MSLTVQRLVSAEPVLLVSLGKKASILLLSCCSYFDGLLLVGTAGSRRMLSFLSWHYV